MKITLSHPVIGYSNKYTNIKPCRKEVNKNQNSAIFSYSANYYLSFGRVSGAMMIEKIGEENFPSKTIFENLKALGRRKDVSLFDVHSQYYSKLSDCATLDEAKAIYPEFCSVIDAKDIKREDMTRAMKQIAYGKIEGADINSLSLDLLKKYYADASVPQDTISEVYYNLSRKTILRIFSLLNIKRYDFNYTKYLTQSKPDYFSRQSQQATEFHKLHPENAKNHSKYMRELYDMHPEKRQAQSQLIRSVSCDNAFVQRQRERTSQFLSEHPEYALTKSIACYMHHEIFEMRSQIASKYPYLGIILRHLEEGAEVPKFEKSILAAYNSECKKACPNAEKLIAKEQKKWLDMYRSGEITIDELRSIAKELKSGL